MNFVIDLIVILIIALTVLISSKKGFVKIIVGVIGFILASYLAFTLSTPLASITYDKILEPAIIDSVSDMEIAGIEDNTDAIESISDNKEAVSEEIANTTEDLDEIISDMPEEVEKVWNSLPKTVTDSAERFGITKETFDLDVNKLISDGKENLVKNVSQEIIKPIALVLLEAIYSIVLMSVLMFIVRIIASIVNKCFSFSIAGKLNTILGAVIGLPKGIIYSIFFCMIVSVIIKFTGGISFFTSENLDKTYLFRLLTNIIPFN